MIAGSLCPEPKKPERLTHTASLSLAGFVGDFSWNKSEGS